MQTNLAVLGKSSVHSWLFGLRGPSGFYSLFLPKIIFILSLLLQPSINAMWQVEHVLGEKERKSVGKTKVNRFKGGALRSVLQVSSTCMHSLMLNWMPVGCFPPEQPVF